MKNKEKKIARDLRSKGYSINEIVVETECAKSSISIWVRDIELTKIQKRRLSKLGHTFDSIEKRRKARIEKTRKMRAAETQAAMKEIKSLTKRELFFFGIGAYWGEGSKRKQGSVEFFNSDPRFIKVMMWFFIEVCGVPISKFKGRVQLHKHMNEVVAEKYWSKVSGIPLNQFQNTSQQVSKASKNEKDTIPLGTFMIGVYDTKLLTKMLGWMEGVNGQVSITCKK